MDYSEFIESVEQRANLSSREGAEQAIGATLETLAEYLDASRAEELADRLPREVAEHLQHERAGSGEELAPDEFVDRVSERADARDPE